MTLEQDIIKHAKQQQPHEMCGFVVFEGKQQRFLPCRNVADDPENFFEIAAEDYINANHYDGIVAIVHSHPNGAPVLSTADRQMQLQSGLDWWLVCDDNVHKFRYIKPLLGREFVHGESDCYSLFRDAYMLSGVDFPDFKRADEWWNEGANLYLDNMEKHGFEQVDVVQRGDVILIQVGADVPNHAAIYLGDNWVLHHSPKRLSKRDLYDGYWLKHTHSIWRYQQWQQLNFTAILNDLALPLI
ncbi:C40 family peptidase [Gallibacterium genomosp. 1]|uniref:Tail protein n=1 Tax=Gallibacterium genomosp. 1 TaxID=155515 RepID=A0A0A2XZQ3_9PAST|nr:C40 family peptidase [Gallibacterium genomosp. 1]KGQ35855.1 tail protein [Gallibacterium genomosp. 1]